MNWKPKRKGKIYCSSACGGECTWRSYQEAKRRAKRLANKLGEGWEPRVWEKFGWHYEAQNGPIKVFYDYFGKRKPIYTVLIGKSFGDEGIWTTKFSSPDLKKAVAHEIKNARKVVNEYDAIVKNAENGFGIEGGPSDVWLKYGIPLRLFILRHVGENRKESARVHGLLMGLVKAAEKSVGKADK